MSEREEVIQTEVLKDIAGMIYGEIPHGEIYPYTFPITSQQTVLRPDAVPSSLRGQAWRMPWLSFTIFNDGPGPVFMSVNKEFSEQVTPLNPGNFLSVDFKKKDAIRQVILACSPGSTASVRIFAVR
jgi:hypothetical protein